MVKYIDTAEIPKKIGEAEIVFEPWKKRDSYERNSQILPRRQDKTIVLPEESETRFYSLLKGEQFLFTTGREDNRSLFFGGMDESPFLVQLHFSMMENLINGEKAFFTGLKPKIIKDWELILSVSAKRQGDFFAVPFSNADWGMFLKKHLGKGSVQMSLAENVPLRDTRHRFTGLMAAGGTGTIMGEGVITAPDHEPLILNRPHLIEQAVGFVRPTEAD